jgi:hypothetical protein
VDRRQRRQATNQATNQATKKGRDEMMSGLASRISAERSRANWGTTGTIGFALKVIGIGLGAGVGLVCCQFLIDALFSSMR